MNIKPTKKEKEFVVAILEVIKQYRDSDFDIIVSLETICKMTEIFGLDDLNLELMSEAFKCYLEMEDE